MNNVMAELRKSLTQTFNGLNPLTAPALYSDHYGDKKRDSLTVVGQDGSLIRLDLLSKHEDKRTGFRGDVMIDKATGHAIIIFKGMDVPLRNEGNGRSGFLRDTFTAAQALISGGKNWQTPLAEKLYQDTLNNPEVKSIEVVGFSLGTLHANYIAAKYGVKGTVLADLGIANRGLKDIFNNNAENVSSAKTHLKTNLTILDMKLDPVSWLGFFRHHGKVIGLDLGGEPDAKGIQHLARNYAANAGQLIKDETTSVGPSFDYAGVYLRGITPTNG